MKRHVYSLAIIVATVSLTTARADRGAIVAVADVNLQEPAQRALIAHDGLEEVLILQTDVQANQAMSVVEFMPLPSLPTVYLAPEGCFNALQETIDRHGLRYAIYTRGGGSQPAEESTVKLVLAEQLGPHQVRVVEVNDVNDFLHWVEQFFGENDLGRPNLGDNLRQVVGSYLAEGLRFFAFDVITAAEEKKTVEPLVYRFKSQEIYYPLRVTNLYGGNGSIELLIIAPEDIITVAYYGLGGFGLSPAAEYAVKDGEIAYKLWRSEMARLTETELEQIEPSMVALFRNETSVLGAVKYEGPLVFTADVKGPLGHGSPETLTKRFLRALDEGDLERLDTLVAVPFALDHESVIEDKAQLMAKLTEMVRQRGTGDTSSYRLTITAIEDYSPATDFDKAFVQKYLQGSAYAIAAESETRQILLYARQTGYGIYRIVGFSDQSK
jgi:hypothetical protein